MTLSDVRHLVGDDRGELSFRVSVRNETGVDSDVAAGSGKGIDLVRGHHKKMKGLTGRIACRRETTAHRVYVFLDAGVIDEG